MNAYAVKLFLYRVCPYSTPRHKALVAQSVISERAESCRMDGLGTAQGERARG